MQGVCKQPGGARGGRWRAGPCSQPQSTCRARISSVSCRAPHCQSPGPRWASGENRRDQREEEAALQHSPAEGTSSGWSLYSRKAKQGSGEFWTWKSNTSSCTVWALKMSVASKSCLTSVFAMEMTPLDSAQNRQALPHFPPSCNLCFPSQTSHTACSVIRLLGNLDIVTRVGGRN